jgi:hypothetical protein
MNYLKEPSFALCGRAYIELPGGFAACVDYEIKPVAGTDRCTGALSAPADFIAKLAEARTVCLVIARGRPLYITIDEPGVLAGVISFTCPNPLTSVDRITDPATINFIP